MNYDEPFSKEKLQAADQPPAKQKSLNSIVKLELLSQKSAGEIEEIWCKHFSGKDCVAAVIPGDTYTTMAARFTEFNTFLFPLPRDQAWCYILS